MVRTVVKGRIHRLPDRPGIYIFHNAAGDAR